MTPHLSSGYHFQLKSTRRRGEKVVISYTFTSPKAASSFVMQAFYHESLDLFMIKFYNSSHKGKNKYAQLTNKGDVRNILRTVFSIVWQLLSDYRTASFGFMGERSYFKDRSDRQTLLEPMENNQRYRVYKLFIQQRQRQRQIQPLFRQEYMDSISSYLFLNKNQTNHKTPEAYDQHIRLSLAAIYPVLNFSDL